MKNQLWLFSAALLIFYSCSQKEESLPEKPLSEQQLEFEIYDSLVVDYLGNLYLADVSQDGKTFMLFNDRNDSIFLTNTEGKIFSKFMRKGEGPEDYRVSRYNPPQFLNNSEIIIPAWKGFYCYSFSGNLTRKFEMGYNPSSSLLDLYNNKLAITKSQVIYPWEGRNGDSLGVQGKSFQLQTKRLEVLDLESGNFTPVAPFPDQSKFKTDQKAFFNFNYTTRLAGLGDSIYVTFRNEPKIFIYHLKNLNEPSKILEIPFEEFIEKAPKDENNLTSYDMKDVYSGSINLLIPTGENRFLINYTRGLTDEEYDQAFSKTGQINQEFYEEISKISTFGWILFDGKTNSPFIEKRTEIGSLGKFISEDEIWFTPNYSEVEKDYVVLYKTRLVSK